jgi:DNA-binding NarL/FixJ family response regulator
MSESARTAVIVDQYPLWLAAVERIVVDLGLEVVGLARSSSEALELVQQTRCDVLVTGIGMPRGEPNGIELTANALARVPSLKVIVLGSSNDGSQIDAAFAAGAAAYVVKTADAEDLQAVIQQVFSDSIFLPPLAAQAQASRKTEEAATPAARPSPPIATGTQTIGGIDLTPREVEILQLVAQGLSNVELAERLWLSDQTVKFHLSNVYRKLDVESRAKASRWAAVHGLLSPDPLEAASPG